MLFISTSENRQKCQVNLNETFTFEVASRIRETREKRSMSQYAVAYSIGMSQAAYSKIERGETEVKVSQLYKIASVLTVSVHVFLPAVKI